MAFYNIKCYICSVTYEEKSTNKVIKPQCHQKGNIDEYYWRPQQRIANEMADQSSTNSEDPSTKLVMKLTLIMIKYSRNGIKIVSNHSNYNRTIVSN